MSKITAIGDVHNKVEKYLEIANNHEYTVQVGDMGFNYTHLNYIDGNKHKVNFGNHENFTKFNDKFVAMQSNHWLGDYGLKKLNGVEFFYFGGGHSIDWRNRTNNVDMFYDEEVPLYKFEEAKELYLRYKPEIMITHEAPYSIIKPFFGPCNYAGNLIQPSNTATMLEWLLRSHRPKLWVFGHFHERRDRVVDGTRFVCLEELGTFDICTD